MGEYTVKALGPGTWNDFADLAGRHNGVWNGCWCTWFHTFYSDKAKDRTAEDNRDAKQQRVNEGRAHAALVFDGDLAVAWCQYGTPDELPNIYHRKEYLAGQKVSAAFLYSATRSLFEQAGFAYDRPKGKNHCVMTKTVAPDR